MTNSQARLISTAIFILAGGVLSMSSHVNINLPLGMLVIAIPLFLVDWWRSFGARTSPG